MPTIDFWCELASTYTYLAVARIDALAADAGVTVRWRPFLLGPIFQAQGWKTSPFEVYPDKGRHMWRDMEREAERLGIPFRRPSVFPRNSAPAAKLALLGMEEGWGKAFVKRVMHAGFAEDRDVASPEVLDAVLAEVGVEGAEARARATSPERSPALRRATEEAMKLRIFGAPTFLVGEEMFWGNDRLEAAIAWAVKSEAARRGA